MKLLAEIAFMLKIGKMKDNRLKSRKVGICQIIYILKEVILQCLLY